MPKGWNLRGRLKALSSTWERRQRRRNKFKFDPSAAQSPTIYFLTPDYNTPAGGIRVIYKHADILNAHGVRSRVVHFKRGFRCDWFENQTQVTSLGETTFHSNDVLAIPEVDADYLIHLPVGLRHLVFNQNAHLTWQRAESKTYDRCPAHATFLGFLTVSEHNRQMLQFAYPNARVSRIHLGIDPDIFFLGDDRRPLRICYMPRRGKNDARIVLNLLENRPALKGYEIKALDGLSHHDVARELRSARIFMAFTAYEGFGLPAAEAMACGAYVIGNHGFGGAEFFHDTFSRPIVSGDALSFAQAVEEAVECEAARPGWCLARGKQAAEYIKSNYSPERETDEVVEFYSSVLKR